MATRNLSEGQEHTALIRMMVNHFTQIGYTNIKADYQGYSQPDPISDGNGNTYIPDITCTKNDLQKTPIVLEAETCGTINDIHTGNQWKAFSRISGEFHITVPKACGGGSGRLKTAARLNELGIKADMIWTPE